MRRARNLSAFLICGVAVVLIGALIALAVAGLFALATFSPAHRENGAMAALLALLAIGILTATGGRRA